MTRPEPELLFDGACGFCRRWIRRWERDLQGRVRCRPYQEAFADYPTLAPDDLARSIHYVDREGRVAHGAEAVLLALANVPKKRWMLWPYRHVPGYRWLAETLYGFVARNRRLASRLTRWIA